MHRAVGLVLVGLLMGAGAMRSNAQALRAGRFTVTPVVGVMRWDDASALANKKADDQGAFTRTTITPTVGIAAEYKLLRQIGAGFYFEAARPTTRGDYFPSVFLNFGANLPAQLQTVSQRVTVMMYGVQGSLAFELGRVQPYVSGGAGGVTVTTDPQQSDGNNAFTERQFQFGGGFGFQVGSATTIRLDVRDFVFTGWEREQLNPVSSAFQNTQFPAANGNPPEAKSTVHNIRFAIGFSYVPRGIGGTEEDEEPEDGR